MCLSAQLPTEGSTVGQQAARTSLARPGLLSHAKGRTELHRLALLVHFRQDLDLETCGVPMRMLELLEARSQRWEAALDPTNPAGCAEDR